MRFMIRDLLWLMVVVALAAGWWLDRTRLAGERNAADAAAGEYLVQIALLRSALRSDAGYDLSFDANGHVRIEDVEPEPSR